jgi:multicomponent Na+:H+ antiporter subunit E
VNLLLLNLLLAVGFMIAIASFTLESLLAGFAVGYASLWLTRPLYGDNRYFNRVGVACRLFVFFLKSLLVSNLRVLWDVVTPSQISRPGIIRMALDARTDLEIMLVANLISLTPGTLSVDLSADRRTLYVHVMFLENIEATRRELKEGLEKRVLEVLR